MVAAGEAKLGLFVERGAGLVDAAVAGEDNPGEDQRLRLGSAFGEPLLDEKMVGAALRQRGFGSGAGRVLRRIRAAERGRARAVATMCLALSPATSYCAPCESWSINTSGRHIERILSPWSSCPALAR